jgi:hypothetical protein
MLGEKSLVETTGAPMDVHVGGLGVDDVVTVPPSGDFEIQQRPGGGRKIVDRIANLLIVKILQHRQAYAQIVCALWFPGGDVNV